MIDIRLTIRERNLVLAAIERTGLERNDFAWSEHRPKVGLRAIELRHQPTGYVFRFSAWEDHDQHRLHYPCEWSPVINGRASADLGTRKDQLSVAETWLQTVKLEHETPDLWTVLAEEAELISGAASEGDRHFTSAEKRVLGERLDQLQRQIVQVVSATADQTAALEQATLTLRNAAESMTRGQWKYTFVGVMFESIVNLALDPQRARQVMQFAAIYIGPLVAHVRGLLG